jgi:RNA polymerase sigma-70 factor (ECF subfamily)
MKVMATSGLFKPDAGPARRLAEVHLEPASETDTELVLAIRQGEAAAAGRLYDRHAATVQRMVYRLLGRDGEIDDILQEVFIYALRSVDKLREPAALKSWLLGIAVGKVRSHLRLRYRRRWLSFLPHDELPEPEPTAPESDAELVQQVRGVLDELPPEERIALVLCRIEGLSFIEAASVSGMSLSTFKRRLSKGEARFAARAKAQRALASLVGGSAS